jgi:REP element-mobilizing transposase RayT
MSELAEFERRKRHLPHWEEPGATYFVTFCLKRGVSVDLTRPEVGRLIVDALRFFDEKRYWLYDYTVMPDHVHAVLKLIVRDGKTEYLWRIMLSVKSWSARRVNALVGRSGPLWQDETYDHIVRDQKDYITRARYIFQNPATEGLIDDPADWPWWGCGSGATLG